MRKRFTADEAALLVPGTPVEWQNGSHWLRAEVTAAPDTDGQGLARCRIVSQQNTRTVGYGEVLYVYPGKVRARG
jgi:hypothetical protein